MERCKKRELAIKVQEEAEQEFLEEEAERTQKPSVVVLGVGGSVSPPHSPSKSSVYQRVKVMLMPGTTIDDLVHIHGAGGGEGGEQASRPSSPRKFSSPLRASPLASPGVATVV